MAIFRKWGIYLSLFLTVIAFILMMATPAFYFKFGKHYYEESGIVAIFGDKDFIYNPYCSPAALIAWIIGLLGIIVLIALIGWSFLGGEIEARYKGIVELIFAFGFVIAGILVFLVVPTYFGANGEKDVTSFYHICGGWIASALLYIFSGLTLAIPGYLNFRSEY